MTSPAHIVLALLVCSQFSGGYTKEDATEDVKGVFVSRAKRSTYDMLRLARGLQMLRLGKRANASPAYLQDDDDVSTDGRFSRSLNSELSRLQFQNKAQQRGFPPDVNDVEETDGLWQFPRETPSNYDTPRDMYAPLDVGASDFHKTIEFEKRQLPMLRLGKRDFEEDEEKRSLNMLRLGKRQLPMLRLGKRQLKMLRLGKRSQSMLRSEDRLNDEDSEASKRSLSMLRLGKRELMMLRLGKREEDDKRSVAMLRLGKRSTQ